MPRNVKAARTSETIAALDCVSSISRRRFHASATTPLTIDRHTIGTTRTRPTRPSASAFFSGHSNDTCHNSAAFCIIDPVIEASRPIQISRKLRWVSATKWSRAIRLEGTNDGVGLVQLFEVFAVLGGQLHVQSIDGFVEMLQFRGTDDGRRDAGAREYPCERHLHPADAMPGRDLADAVGNREVGVGEVEPRSELVAIRASRVAAALFLAIAGEKAARHRAVRNHADTFRSAERHHLALLLAVDQVEMVLHRHELRPAVLLRDRQHLRELPGIHARRPNVARLSGAHDVVERLHRLFYRRVVIEAMDLIQIDVVHAETTKRRVDAVEQMLT